ncbi:MAG: M14 family zinc carboxypeptidase [Myxococcota bacterium]
MSAAMALVHTIFVVLNMLQTTNIGYSPEGRPIRATVVGAFDAPNRSLVIAGQHGDEPLAVEAVEEVAARLPLNPHRAVAFVICANPDGHAAQTRRTAQGIDLNRDHQYLAAPETQALHAFARAFRPQMIVDAHTFKPRRRVLLDHGLEWGADVMVELDNHPHALTDYGRRWKAWICPVKAQLAKRGILIDRYLVASATGGLRASSSDIVDVRNGLASSVGAMGILVEGREPSRRYGSKDQTRHAMAQTIEALIERSSPPALESVDECSILYLDIRRQRASAFAFTLSCTDDRPVRRRLPGYPSVDVTPMRPVIVPGAYGVPRRFHRLIGVLSRHGLTPVDPQKAKSAIRVVQAAYIQGGKLSRRALSLRRPTVEWRVQQPCFEECLYYLTEQPRGHRLAALLEPGSRFGLHRYPDLGIPVAERRLFDVVRGYRDRSLVPVFRS